MSHNRSEDTSTEMVVRRTLHSLGFRYSLHKKNLPGHPDIVLKKHNLCIFVNGCFWHHHSGCKKASLPKTNTEYWRKKFRANRERDARVVSELKELGWRVLVIWECETKKQETLLASLSRYLPIKLG